MFTDRREHDVGTGAGKESSEAFDTSTLVECWRTGPYLHDGSAATMREVLTTRNRADRHGRTSNLTALEVEDLAEFVLSL